MNTTTLKIDTKSYGTINATITTNDKSDIPLVTDALRSLETSKIVWLWGDEDDYKYKRHWWCVTFNGYGKEDGDNTSYASRFNCIDFGKIFDGRKFDRNYKTRERCEEYTFNFNELMDNGSEIKIEYALHGGNTVATVIFKR